MIRYTAQELERRKLASQISMMQKDILLWKKNIAETREKIKKANKKLEDLR